MAKQELIINIIGDNKDLLKALKVSQKELSKFSKRAGKLSKTFKNLSKDISSFGNKTGLLFAGLAASVGVFLKTAGNFEQWRIAFEVMLGSAEKAKILLKEIEVFAKRTPFQLTEVVQASKQLLAVGFKETEIIDTLNDIGNAASALNVPVSRLILNLGQVRTQGKLTGRELRDFLIAGVPLARELAKSLGVTKAQLSKMVSAGVIGFPEVRQAFKNMSSEGGIFFNLMDRQSQTFLGIISNIKDSLTILAKTLGDALLPQAKKFAKTIQDILKRIQNMDKVKLAKFAKQFVKVTLAIGALTIALKLTAIALKLASVGMTIYANITKIATVATFLFSTAINVMKFAFNPLGLAIIAVVAILVLLQSKFDIFGKTINFLKRQWVEFKTDLLGGLIDIKDKSTETARDYEFEWSEAFKNTKSSWIANQNGMFEATNNGFGVLKEQTKKTFGVLSASFVESSKEVKIASEEAREATIKAAQEARDATIKAAQEAKDAIMKSAQEAKKAADEAAEKTKQTLSSAFDFGFNLIQDFKGTITNLFTKFFSGEDFKKKITDAFGGGLAGALGGGAIGGIIAFGLNKVMSAIFGGKGKSFQDLVQEAFQKITRNVNRILEGIGKEETRIDTQLKILERLSSQLGLGAELRGGNLENFAEVLDVEVGTTIKEAIIQLGDRLLGAGTSETNALKDEIRKAQDRISQIPIDIDNLTDGPRKALFKLGELTAEQAALQRFIAESQLKLATSSQFTLEEILENISNVERIAQLIGTTVDPGKLTATVPGFASGASKIKDDTLGIFSKNEIVIPASFSQGIRRGDFALVGKGGMSSGTESNFSTVNNNNITIMANDKDPELVWQELKPFLDGQAIKSDLGDFSGVFQG